jgi:kynurenine formamidase
VTAAEFRAIFDAVSNWDRWGDRSRRGTLNYLTRERVAAAAELARSGITVKLGRPLATEAGIENPEPADHHMTMLTDVDVGSGSLRFTKDYIGADYHNEGHSHVDALCHVAFDGHFFNGEPTASVTSDGALAGAVDLLEDGLVGRGVLLDIPRARGVRWIEPGEYVFREDLERAEREQGVEVRTGDILLVRTGHALRQLECEPWDTSRAKAGLHPDTAPFLSERCVAALGSDGNNDTAPSVVEGVAFPIHVLAINAMGMHILDYLQFEDLVARCVEAGRWEFLFVGAPLLIEQGTGSPLNPIAIF